jgi:hypothetical protein
MRRTHYRQHPLEYIGRAYGSQISGHILWRDGLKSIPTKSVEPTALNKGKTHYEFLSEGFLARG